MRTAARRLGMTRLLCTRRLRAHERQHAARLGLTVDDVEVLQIDPVEGLVAQWLDTVRHRARRCDAWAFTSRHAVAALATLRSGGLVDDIPECHAVGPGTAAALAAIGIEAQTGPGTGRELGQLIAASGSIRRVLHWRGEEIAGTLGQELASRGVAIDEWVVYRKRARHFAVDPRPYAGILVLSPSGVRALARNLSAPLHDGLRFVAIGPTTAGEVETVFSRRACMAGTPSVIAMLDCASLETVSHGPSGTHRLG